MTQQAPYNLFTSYRINKIHERGPKDSYETGIYTHASGQEAHVTVYDYKSADTAYKALEHDALMLALVAEKQSRYQKVNAAVPKLMAVINKSNRLIVIRQYAEGVMLGKLPRQSAKSAAYIECAAELERVTKSLTAQEYATLPRITREGIRSMMPRLIMKALISYPDRIREIMTIAFTFYRNAPRRTEPGKEFIANRMLTPRHIICGSDQIFMTDFKESVLAPEGFDISLFPKLYYRSVGSETMRQFLDEQTHNAEPRRRFLHLAAFNALYDLDEAYLPVLAGSIIPYVRSIAVGEAKRGSFSIAVPRKHS